MKKTETQINKITQLQVYIVKKANNEDINNITIKRYLTRKEFGFFKHF